MACACVWVQGTVVIERAPQVQVVCARERERERERERDRETEPAVMIRQKAPRCCK
jgi:hypothetical protein